MVLFFTELSSRRVAAMSKSERPRDAFMRSIKESCLERLILFGKVRTQAGDLSLPEWETEEEAREDDAEVSSKIFEQQLNDRRASCAASLPENREPNALCAGSTPASIRWSSTQ
jgi:hypothetical protein